MENEKLKQIFEILQKIKKKQESLKQNLNDIGNFINASFEKQNQTKNNAIYETENRIKNNLEKNLKIAHKEISNQIEKYLPFKNESNDEIDENNNKEFEINDKDTEIYLQSKFLDNDSDKMPSLSSEEEEELNNIKKEGKERLEKEKEEKIHLKFLSDDIVKQYNYSQLKELCNISFQIAIKNIGNTSIPDKTYIKFNPRNNFFKCRQQIDKLLISEEKKYTIKLLVDGEKIKNEFKDRYYETDIIFYNKEHDIDFKPIKFKFIVINSNEDDSDEEKEVSTNKLIDKDNNNDNSGNDYSNDDNNNNNKYKNSYKDIELQGEELKKFREELEIKYYISNLPKNDKDIIRKVNVYKEDYYKYLNEQNEENKEKLFDNLIEKIGDDLAFVETKIT